MNLIGGRGTAGRVSTAITASIHLVVFTLDEIRYGLPLAGVERILRAVEITPLPAAPEIVLGVVNVQGRVIAVANIRKRFGLSERQPALSDQMIVARTPKRSVALLADAVTGVLEYSEHEAVAAPAIVPGTQYLAGVVKLADGMVLIHDLAGLLSLDEERRLDEAMSHA